MYFTFLPWEKGHNIWATDKYNTQRESQAVVIQTGQHLVFISHLLTFKLQYIWSSTLGLHSIWSHSLNIYMCIYFKANQHNQDSWPHTPWDAAFCSPLCVPKEVELSNVMNIQYSECSHTKTTRTSFNTCSHVKCALFLRQQWAFWTSGWLQ